LCVVGKDRRVSQRIPTRYPLAYGGLSGLEGVKPFGLLMRCFLVNAGFDKPRFQIFAGGGFCEGLITSLD